MLTIPTNIGTGAAELCIKIMPQFKWTSIRRNELIAIGPRSNLALVCYQYGPVMFA